MQSTEAFSPEPQEAQIELLQAELDRSREEAIELRAKNEGFQTELAEAKTKVSVLIERCAQLERSLSDAKELESQLIAQFAKPQVADNGTDN